MAEKMKLPVILLLLVLCLGIPAPGTADGGHGQLTEPGSLVPENTVVLANEMDARFSLDFSVLLSQLRMEWVILDSTVLPESVWDKNLILLGHPDAAYTGEIIREILTAEEIEMLRTTTDRHVVIKKESPWAEGRTVTICSGANRLLTRNAAEKQPAPSSHLRRQLTTGFRRRSTPSWMRVCATMWTNCALSGTTRNCRWRT